MNKEFVDSYEPDSQPYKEILVNDLQNNSIYHTINSTERITQIGFLKIE